jgi:hypothetical protein
MGIMEDMEDYITTYAQTELKLVNVELEKKIPGIFKNSLNNVPIVGGYTKKRGWRKKGGATGLNKNETNTPTNTQGALTKKNATNTSLQNKRSFIELQKTLTLIFLSILSLEALTTLHKILPSGMSFIQVLTFFGNDAYTRILLPFMKMMASTFTFFANTTLPNVMEGIYLKILNTLNGNEALADPNRLFATVGNVFKVSSWMTVFFSTITRIAYTPKETVIEDKEVEPMLRDILKTIEEKVKKVPKYSYMKIPDHSVLMTVS